MQEADFNARMNDLIAKINTLPAEERIRLEALARETRTRHEKLRKTVGLLQESLDQLRLSVKYLVFDLEATRRENDYLRKLLAEQNGTH
jgi:hypothetical protein